MPDMQGESPLRGIKVLDLSTLLPGPYCTMLLAALGAQVLKVENPGGGDFMRSMSPGLFQYLNASKDLLTLDLKSQRGREIFLDLAADCDVLVEGFRPGVVARLGVDFDSLKRGNHSIIYCSLSGYGQDGPYANLPGHDLNYMGVAGLLSISGEPVSGRPEYPYGPQYADLMGAMFASNAILAALVGRTPGSPPRFLDVSLAESTAMLMMPRYLEFMSRDCPPKKEFMARGPYGVFECRDHKFLTLAIVEDHFWVNFCQAAGLSHLAEDPELRGWASRNQQAGRLRPILQETFKAKDRQDWLELLTQADVPVSPAHDLNEWTRDPQMLAREFFLPAGNPEETAAQAPRFPVPALGRGRQDSPREAVLGRDSEKWLLELGIEAKEIDSLREEKII